MRKLLGPKVLILAQSGTAARNVKGSTIQSALSIGIDTTKIKPMSAISKANKIKEFREIE